MKILDFVFSWCNKITSKRTVGRRVLPKINISENDPLLNGLNDEQKKAVVTTEGRVRIVAGAGSGKTRVFAHRYAFLVERLGIDSAHILCLTFTNKAASEMKNRISNLVPNYKVNDYICTIHGFCVKFLRQEIYRIGYPKNFQIIDNEDGKSYVKQIMEVAKINRNASTIKNFLNNIRKEKYTSRKKYVEELIIPNVKTQKYSDDIFAQYVLLQKKYNTLDFDDIMCFTLYILHNYSNVRKQWSDKFNYVQVDEVQDCNESDWEIIKIISSKFNNLFIVGDPDQSIYEWRGARPNRFVNFVSDSDIILNQNYRSTQNILNVANSIIKNNKNRIDKDLITLNPMGNTVIHFHAKSEEEEGDWIATQISKLIKNGADNSDFAILYRASYMSRYIEQALMKKNLSYTIWGGIRFFERKEIKDCICYLKMIAYNDDMAFRRIVNVPSRKFGKITLEKLEIIAKKENKTLYETLKLHIEEQIFNKPKFLEFIKIIEHAKNISSSASILELMNYILEETGLMSMYRMDEDEDCLENITELLSSLKFYMDNNAEDIISLDKYLQDIALYTNADYKNDVSKIKLMTIHQSKGLEFPYVFISGLNEGIFPNERTIREKKQNGLEEERRLMYVATTRAEKELFITESEGFSFSVGEKLPSRFILEIPQKMKNVIGDVCPSLIERAKKLIQQMNEEDFLKLCSWKVGDIVVHKFFGRGEILEFNDTESSCKVKFKIGVRDVMISTLAFDGIRS